MSNYEKDAKLLYMHINENYDKYLSEECYVDESMKRTEQLYDQAFEAAKTSNASRFTHDSDLMQLQSKIIRERAKAYKPDTLVFVPREFSEKLKKHFMGGVSIDDRNKKLSHQQYSRIWSLLGEESLKKMHFAPTFDFLYGTFSAEPASPVKKKRKRIEKEKLAAVVKPKTVDMSENTGGRDFMMKRAGRIYTVLKRLLSEKKKKAMCFYEFVIDPQSFTRTIENIFTVTLLLQSGFVCIFPDEQGLPCLRDISDPERKERNMDPRGRMQSVLSMSVEEWKAIIRKCNFTKPVIPPDSKETQEK